MEAGEQGGSGLQGEPPELGAACVRFTAENGAKVVIADSEGGESLATELRATGASVIFAQTNVTNEESMQATVRTAMEQHGGSPHLSINCAGIGIAEKVIWQTGVHSLANFQKVISVNLMLHIQCHSSGQCSDDGERANCGR